MASIQRKFAACLITLFIVLSIGYTAQTTKRTPDGCNEIPNLANSIRDCLNGRNIQFERVSVTNCEIEVVLKENKDRPVSCQVIYDIIECANIAVAHRDDHYLTISTAPPTQNATTDVLYKGHTGTGTIPDIMPSHCIDVLANKGTLNINSCNLEKKVKEDAKRLNIKIEKLNVKVKKGEGDKYYLEVSGKVSTSEFSELQVKRIKRTVAKLVWNYTYALRINTDNFKVLPARDKDRRIK